MFGDVTGERAPTGGRAKAGVGGTRYANWPA